MVTVRVVVPDPDTPTVPVAVPVVFNVTSPGARVTESAPVYVTVYVTGPVFVTVSDGVPIDTVGAVLSTVYDSPAV
jgi:hypothetical protein